MARPRFDPKLPLVAARSFDYQGRPYKAGDPFPAPGASVPEAHKLRTLYGSRLVNHGEAVAAAPVDPVQMEGTPGGWYTITAPWLDEPMRVRGKAGAEKAAEKLRTDGEPPTHHGVTLTEGDNGWWEVKADWASEGEKVHGEADARARAAELRAGGPPPDPRTEVTVDPGLVMGEAEGQFVVNAPWLEEAMILPTREAAEAEAERLRRDGPPDGWEPAPESEPAEPA